MGHFALSYQISNRLRDVSQTPGTLELAEKKLFSNQNKCGKFSYKGAVELRCQSTPSISILSAKVLYRDDTSLGPVSRSPDNFSGPESRFVFVVARIC